MLANGVVENHSYDAAGRETTLEQRKGALVLASFASTYDAGGRRTRVTEADGSLTNYLYDADGQLLSETRLGSQPHSITYQYDAAGNRTREVQDGVEILYSYDDANQLLSQQVGGSGSNSITSYEYDLNGNCTKQETDGLATRLGWSVQNFLSAVVHPGGASESYTYCGEGIRRTKQTQEGTTRFIRDGHNILLEVREGVGTVETLRRYTHAGEAWGEMISLRQGAKSRFFGFDQSANTRLLTDGQGGVSDSYLYSAFGEEKHVSGTTVNPFRFGGEVGYYRDDAERLYVRARHLDVGVGRWLSRDPLGFEGGDANLYLFALNNSISFVDANGEAPSPPPRLPKPPAIVIRVPPRPVEPPSIGSPSGIRSAPRPVNPVSSASVTVAESTAESLSGTILRGALRVGGFTLSALSMIGILNELATPTAGPGLDEDPNFKNRQRRRKNKKFKLALGLTDNGKLFKFALKHDAYYYGTWEAVGITRSRYPDGKSQLDAATILAGQILFRCDGGFSPNVAMDYGSRGPKGNNPINGNKNGKFGNFTNYEYYRITTIGYLYNKTTFYKRGKKVKDCTEPSLKELNKMEPWRARRCREYAINSK